MFRFKHFLLEIRRSTPQVKAWLSGRSKPYEYWLSRMFDMPFPISKPMMTRLGNTEEGTEAIHITDIDGLETLIGLQNSSKSISVMTFVDDVMGGMSMLAGVETAGGIVVEVTGDIPFIADFDIFTSTDNQGRRWMDLKQFKTIKKFKNNPDFFRNWESIYERIINEATQRFVFKGKHYDEIQEIVPKEIMDLRYNPSHSDIYFAKIFWIGSQDRRIADMSDKDAVAWRGIKYAVEMAGYNYMLPDINRELFRMTKDLFDAAEDYFSDNVLEFYDMASLPVQVTGRATYNEGVMDDFTITAVYYDGVEYVYGSVERFTGSIPTHQMTTEMFEEYFEKWVRK